MWKKILVVTLVFYFFALLQNSFFANFSVFGTLPNLVFALFFVSAFFDKSVNNYYVIFLAIMAGFFLDIFSHVYFGPSIVILLLLAVALKGAQSLLKNREDVYPFAYFLPLFCVSFLIYSLLFGFSVITIFSLIYNSLIATVLFFIYKWQKLTE